MISIRLFALILLFASSGLHAAPPQLYRQAAHESPVAGEPDDLLLLAGYGFASDDSVIYRAVEDTTKDLAAPRDIPADSTAAVGVAAIVSAADVPYSLTVRLPSLLRKGHSYALWVRNAHKEWSLPVLINDARPLWMSPAYINATGSIAGLPRELKVVGRNLQPLPGQSTRIRLSGPQEIIEKALVDSEPSATIDEYVARFPLPAHLTPGRYRAMLSRDGVSWVSLEGQSVQVLVDVAVVREFKAGDPQFGGCRADDGVDDTPCILRAVDAAARAGGGAVIFGPGTWDLIDNGQLGHDGIVVPAGVQLRGSGSSTTRIVRHAQWSARAAAAAFSLVGHTTVTGITFRDLAVYQPDAVAGPFLQLGEDWRRSPLSPGRAPDSAEVNGVVITRNVFDKPFVAVGSGGLPINRLFITYNTFGAYSSALELNGDKYDTQQKYRLDDSVIAFNVFKPGAKLDVPHQSGPLASELGAGDRVDFSGNIADGTSTDYLYTPDDPKGWTAAFFWNPNNNVERVLVSQNSATCTADKIGDGQAIAFDNNTNTSAFDSLPMVASASSSSVAVTAPLAARQFNRDVPVATYYVGHWVQIVSGPGLGQVRKIVGYSTDSVTHLTTFRVAPAWDVTPVSGRSRIGVGREYWQLYVIDNHVDNRQPLCLKSNRSRRVGGGIGLWAQTADSVLAGNRQFDSDGIFAQQNYAFVTQNYDVSEHPCPDCTIMAFFNFFLEIRDNVIDGEYDWSNDCSRSGIALGVAAAPWAGEGPPPTVSFGVSVAHNTVRHADAQYGGAIAQLNTWLNGPAPNRWPLSDNLLIHHNSIADIDGPRAMPICGSSRARIGIAFPDPAIAWRTVLYANTCKNVSTPIGSGGIDSVRVCPSHAQPSCECPINSP